jgi:hypothetical protein
MVTIKTYGEGTCLWCRREGKEGVEVTSDDRSFVGFLCFPDLKRMLRLKSTAIQPNPIDSVQKASGLVR